MSMIEKTFHNLEDTQQWLKGVAPKIHLGTIKVIISEPSKTDPAEDFLANLDQLAVDTGVNDLAEQHDHYLQE